MKPQIHPNYTSDITVTCSCGNTFVTGSTQDTLRVEICGACHPFYTGQERIIDSARRVEKYEAKRAALAAAPKVKKVKDAVRKAKREEAAKTKKAEEGK